MKKFVVLAVLALSYNLQAAPVVSSVSPLSGDQAGGTTLTVTGSGFLGATSVQFGSSSATPTVINDTTLTVVTPVNANGAGDVRVTNGVNTSPRENQEKRSQTFSFIRMEKGEWGYCLQHL